MGKFVNRLATSTVAGVSTALLSLPLLAAPASAGVVDDAPDASWQVNGPVYASAVIGDTVYVGGRFTAVVSSSGDRMDRNRLAAFSISTGKPLSWNPGANDVVWALEADDDSVWAGGDFTSVDSSSAKRLVKLDAKNGSVDKKFEVEANNTVRALEVQKSDLYVGGKFTVIDGRSQAYLAQVSAKSGKASKGFDPDVERMVRAIVAPSSGSGNDLYVAGNFYKVNGSDQRKIALLNGSNGKLKTLTFEKPATTRALDISPDGKLLYGGIGGDIDSAVAWSTDSGERVFRHKVSGDVHTVAYHRGTLWMGFAKGALDDRMARIRALDATTGVADPNFAPVINSQWGVRTIAATDRGVVIGGNFWKIGGEKQKFLAFFR